MPWKAIPFGDKRKEQLSKLYGVSGIHMKCDAWSEYFHDLCASRYPNAGLGRQRWEDDHYKWTSMCF